MAAWAVARRRGRGGPRRIEARRSLGARSPGVLVIFGAATVARGSGFLAVLVASIIIGDQPAPYKREIEALPLLARVALGDRRVRHARADRAAVRPRNRGGLGLRPRPRRAAGVRDPAGPRRPGVAASQPHRAGTGVFLWTGLKGAVPILLGMAIVESGTAVARQDSPTTSSSSSSRSPSRSRAGLVPALPTASASRCGASNRSRGRSASGSARNRRGCTAITSPPARRGRRPQVGDLGCGEYAWISLVVRGGTLLSVTGDLSPPRRRRRADPRRPRPRPPRPRALLHRPSRPSPGAGLTTVSAGGGFEPPQCFHQQDLNLPRLPFRHARAPLRGSYCL